MSRGAKARKKRWKARRREQRRQEWVALHGLAEVEQSLGSALARLDAKVELLTAAFGSG